MSFDITSVLKGVSDPDTKGGRQIIYLPVDKIDPDPDNFYSLAGIDELADSIALIGLQQPLLVRHGKELGRYPLSIYGKEILAIFTFVLPFACAQYYPFLYLSGRSDSLLYALAPLACFLFLIPCYVFWRIGLRHYRSTGS